MSCAPELIDIALEYGRLAVEVFLAMGGFLMARSLTGGQTSAAGCLRPLGVVTRRYRRLAIPFMAAMVLAIGCAALARHLLQHEAIPGVPTRAQYAGPDALPMPALAGEESLLAGAWYVAIDLQLFALSVLLLRLARPWPQPALLPSPALWLFGTVYGGVAVPVQPRSASGSDRPVVLRRLWARGRRLVGRRPSACGARTRRAGSRRPGCVGGRLPHPDRGGPGHRTRAGDSQRGLAGAESGAATLEVTGLIWYSVFLVHFPFGLLVNAVFSAVFTAQAPWPT
jgi:peptidoglycan/LPS O-acetylase OafA/YrhL